MKTKICRMKQPIKKQRYRLKRLHRFSYRRKNQTLTPQNRNSQSYCKWLKKNKTVEKPRQRNNYPRVKNPCYLRIQMVIQSQNHKHPIMNPTDKTFNSKSWSKRKPESNKVRHSQTKTIPRKQRSRRFRRRRRRRRGGEGRRNG